MSDNTLISRKEAKEKGLRFYFSGTPCKHGHIAQRYVSEATCCVCESERARARHEKNKDSANERNRRHYKDNIDKIKLRQNQYRLDNKDKLIGIAKKYRQENLEKAKAAVRAHYYKNKERLAQQHKEYNKTDNAIAYRKQYRTCNKERLKEYHKQWRQKNKLQIDAHTKEHRKNNPHVRKAWEEKNKERLTAYARKYMLDRRNSDTNFKLVVNLRTRVYRAIKNNYKSGSAVHDLGCSIDEFKAYISAKFRDGMTWGNWGSVWELDHIIPLCSFDLTNREQFLVAVHYKNHQPLTIADHETKSVEDRKKAITKTPIAETRMKEAA